MMARAAAPILTLLLVIGTANAEFNTAAAAGKTKDSIISKVIDMLGKEKGKIADDLESENKEMTEYFGYCDDVQKELGYYISEATRKINDGEALIEDRTAQVSSLEEELAELGAEVAERNEEMDTEIKFRKKQHKEFLVREEEQQIMVEELTKMEQALEQQMAAMTTPPPVPVEGEALTQEGGDDDSEETVEAPSEGYETLVQLGAHRKGALKGRTHHRVTNIPRLTMAMLRKSDIGQLKAMMSKVVGSLLKDPESQSYAKVVNGFIQAGQGEDPGTVEVSSEAMAGQQDMEENNMAAFGSLKGKAEAALQRERDGEAEKQANHETNLVSIRGAISIAEDKIEDCKKDKARLSGEKAEAVGEVATAKAARAEDDKRLKDLTTECDGAAEAWDTRQKEAKEEMAAIEKAKEILASRVTVFVQRLTSSRKASEPAPMGNTAKVRQTLINHFRKLGTKLHSLTILNFVSVSSAQPLDKVMGLIKELIAKLQKEAAEAADMHEFCNAEKKKNEEAMEKATGKRDELQTTIDKASARKEELADIIATLQSEIAEIDASTMEAEKLRNEQHTTFVKAEADFTEAAAAVQDAMDVLSDYYDNALLVQTGSVKSGATKKGNAPPKLGGAKSDSAGGILNILDTMAAEFTKTVAELQSEEKEQVKAYKEMKEQNFNSKNAKETEIIKSENEIGSMDITLGHSTEDIKLTKNEIAAIEEYVQKLKPTCEGRPMSYAERKAKRDAEIEGLKEALAILEEATPTLLQTQAHSNLRH